MKRSILMALARGLALATLLLAASPGCLTAHPEPGPGEAIDPVCDYDADLGCVIVRVDETTPRATYEGKVYYFCCDQCRVRFEKDPAKYARAGAAPR